MTKNEILRKVNQNEDSLIQAVIEITRADSWRENDKQIMNSMNNWLKKRGWLSESQIRVCRNVIANYGDIMLELQNADKYVETDSEDNEMSTVKEREEVYF